MSYTLTAYAVDLPHLQGLMGSKDESAVEAVLEHNAEFFAEEEEEFDDDELFLSAAIRQLVMGKKLDPDEAHQYGYALKEICGAFGELLPCDAWSGVRWQAVEACGLDKLLTKTGAPVKLPPNDSFPNIGHLRRGPELQAALAAAQTTLTTSDDEAEELLEEFIGWIQAAEESDRDLVFFYY